MKRKSRGQQQQQQQSPASKQQLRKAGGAKQHQQHHQQSQQHHQQQQSQQEGPIIRHGDCFTQLELQPGQGVVLTGAAALEVTSGCLWVYGARVTPQCGPLVLHAPSKLSHALLLAAPAAAAAAAAAAPPAQALLHPLHSAAAAGVVASQQPAAAAAAAEVPRAEAFAVADATAAGAPTTWQVPVPWQQAVADLTATAAAAAAAAAAAPAAAAPPLVVAVCGAKRAGKSAFARLLVNALLSSSSSSSSGSSSGGSSSSGSSSGGSSSGGSSSGSAGVAYLDLDPGQPEFTPPGLLSLHLLQQPVFGPAHLQQHHQPLLQFFQGDTSSQSDPGRYLTAAQQLCGAYHALLAAQHERAAQPAAAAGGGGGSSSGAAALPPPPPLVVNTPGWITGLGCELLGEVMRCVQPTHVVQLQTSNAKKNLPSGCWWWDPAAAAAGAPPPPPLLLHVPAIDTADGLAQGGGAAAAAAAAAAAGGGGGSIGGGTGAPAAAAASCAAASVQSGDTEGVTAGGGGSGAKGGKGPGLSAAAARGLMWLSWAQRVVAAHQRPAARGGALRGASAAAGAGAADGSSSSGGGGCQLADAPAASAAARPVPDEFQAAAAGLAAARPLEASLAGLEVDVLHAEVAQDALAVALNGAVVGLASSGARVAGGGGNSSGSAGARGLLPCLGLGLVRAVDAPRQRLFLLTDLPEARLAEADTLLLGKLELPERLLEGRCFASPYQGLFCLASAATGAGQIKSRNNLLRASQVGGLR